MNDDKPFQLFRDDDENTPVPTSGNARSSALFIVILMLVIGGAITILVLQLSSDNKPQYVIPEDPNMVIVEPAEFMIDINSSIGGFNELLETTVDTLAVADAEQTFNDLIIEMEDIANQSRFMGEPSEEERPDLRNQLEELKTLVLRLEKIAQQKQADRELWKVLEPHYTRFDAALRMVPLIPPRGFVDPTPDTPAAEAPEAP